MQLPNIQHIIGDSESTLNLDDKVGQSTIYDVSYREFNDGDMLALPSWMQVSTNLPQLLHMLPTEEQVYQVQIQGNGWTGSNNLIYYFNLYSILRDLPPDASPTEDTDPLPYPVCQEKATISTVKCLYINISKDHRYVFVADAEGD